MTTRDQILRSLTPAERVDLLKDFLPVVVDVLLSDVNEDTRGQTARITFNEDTHPLIKLMVDELGDRLPSKQFTLLLVELDDNGHAVDIVKRAKVRRLMNKHGKTTKHFFAMLNEEEFHRWLYSIGEKYIAAPETKTERAELARVWADKQGIDPHELDIDVDAKRLFDDAMRIPYYLFREKRRGQRNDD